MKLKTHQLKSEKKSDRLLGDLFERIDDLLEGGEDRRTQEVIIPQLKKILDNSFVLLVNYPLPELKVEIPMILVGPSGVWVMCPSEARGIYRAKGEEWLEMNDRKRKFEPARENLVARAKTLARGVEKYLAQHEITPPEVEAVLLFSNPGIHVDTARPVVRIVLRDALPKFAASIQKAPQVIAPEDIHDIISLLTRGKVRRRGARPPGEESAAQPTIDEASVDIGKKQPSTLDRQIQEIAARLNLSGFSTSQWLILGSILAFGILGIVVLLLYAIFFL